MSTEIKTNSASSRVVWNKRPSHWPEASPPGEKRSGSFASDFKSSNRKRDLAMFNLAIDSKLRGCDLVSLLVDDIASGGHVRDRATIVQHKSSGSVRDHGTDPSLAARLVERAPPAECGPARAGDSSAYGTHSMRRTKAAQIYRKIGNLRAVQLLLGHTKIESTVHYLGIEVDDALTLSEQVEI